MILLRVDLRACGVVTMSLEANLKTLAVPEAGKLLGLGRSAAYAAAANGELPVIRFGKLMRVPLVALQRMMAEAGQKPATPEARK
jgi:excisionase family DNA binding protein